MQLPLVLIVIVIGIILGVATPYGAVGLACVLVGLVLLVWPRLHA